jgi:putative ABC transport system permease protein
MATGWLGKILQRLRATSRPDRLNRDLDDEIAFHLAQRTDRNRAAGMDATEARYAAHRQLGNVTNLKERTREVRILTSLETLWRDFTYALRGLRKKPGFTAVAMATLALGIGSSTAVFSVIENVLIEPFAYPDANRFMTVEIHDANNVDAAGRAEYSAPEFLDYIEQNHVFDLAIADASEDVLYQVGGGMERLHGVLCTPNTFEFFGLPALFGRVMEPADYEPAAPPTFILGYKAWKSHFGGDPSIIGQTYILNGAARTLVGIMPRRFGWGDGDVFLPVKPTRAEQAYVSGEFPPVWYLMGHLKHGVSVAQAQADLTVIANRLAKIYPKSYPPRFVVKIVSATDMVVGNFRTTLTLTLGAVALLLLISCANLANLMLARATTREKEFAVRSALGASRWRLIRQLLVESLILSVCGGAIGVGLAALGLNSIVALIPPITIPAETEISLNLPVLAFALGVAMLTPMLFGLVPALRAARNDLERPLRDSGKSTSSGTVGQGRFRDAVIVCEVALSFTLLVGAGLLMRSFVALRGVSLGLSADHVLVTRLPLPSERYQTASQLVSFYRPLLERLKALPGVTDVAESSALPPYGGFPTDVEVSGVVHSEKWPALFQLCSERFFSVLHIQLRDGRFFDETEVNAARKVAVINETFAQRYFDRANPIGRRIRVSDLTNFPDKVDDPWFEVVGVVSDVRNKGLQEPTQPEVWLPYTLTGSGQRGVLVRTANDPLSLMDSLRREVWAVDRSVALTYTGSMENYIHLQSYAGPQFGFILMTIFAMVGLALVSIGVYSVVAYATARRTHEIGIRMALGATRSGALRLVLGMGLRVIAVGVAIGLIASLALSRILASQLWQTSAHDPLTIFGVAILLLAIGVAACVIPARRATSIEPTLALRHE